MDQYEFFDSLAFCTLTCSYPGLESSKSTSATIAKCDSVFFPGCSFINYALPLVQAVYDLLKGAGRVDGISLLCCGKILEYEPDGKAVKAAFQEKLRERLVQAGVKRVVAACPNCVRMLREVTESDERTKSIEIVALPVELSDMGYRIDPGVTESMVRADYRCADQTAPVKLAVHDSCPDRERGEFADGLRGIMPAETIVDPEHCREKSFCCGSRPRAAGNGQVAAKLAQRHGEEAKDAGANGMVTACMSCAFLLSVLQQDYPVFHYLELLYNWRINWYYADQWMKLRFLIDEEEDDGSSHRKFMGIG